MAIPDDWRQRIETHLRAQVPLARAMQVEVRDCGEASIRLGAPLAVNHNHKGTAFGGSQYALAALAGWGLLVVTLWRHRLGGEIVIQDGSIRYSAPVEGDLEVLCRPAEGEDLQHFVAAYRRHQRARIALRASIEGPRGPAMEFLGRYVAGV